MQIINDMSRDPLSVKAGLRGVPKKVSPSGKTIHSSVIPHVKLGQLMTEFPVNEVAVDLRSNTIAME